MLKGSYKNDYATRSFFKALIGSHFHFTAYGIDWLQERWEQGKPPTYREFANMWQSQWQWRKQQKVDPKEEWAYLNFCQQFMKKYPHSSRSQMMKEWKEKREAQVTKAHLFLEKLQDSLKKNKR